MSDYKFYTTIKVESKHNHAKYFDKLSSAFNSQVNKTYAVVFSDCSNLAPGGFVTYPNMKTIKNQRKAAPIYEFHLKQK